MRDWSEFVRARLSLPDLSPSREARIIREIAVQLEDFYREALARGASAAEADTHAQAQIPDWNRMAQDLREANRPQLRPRMGRLTGALEERSDPKRGAVQTITNILTDVRYGSRQIKKAPGFAIVAILTLAFGIGATSAIFSVLNGVVLRPLPYPEPERLVRLFEVVPRHGRFSVAPGNFLDWRQQNDVFERIAAYRDWTETFTGSDGAERIATTMVSWDLFELLKVAPALGRGFIEREDAPGKAGVIILSHGMWQRRFGGDPAVLGRTISLSGAAATIVGVMPEGFHFPTPETELWQPIALDRAKASRGAHFLDVAARLKPGVSFAQAGEAMKVIAARLAPRYPDTNRDESVETILMHDLIVGPIRPMLLTLLAAVGAVVLIACVNVANLLLVRASVREKEIAIRSALGADRRRLIMQMLAESLLLAILGGGCGVLFAGLAITPIQTLSAGSIPRVADVALDRNVLAFALFVSLATGILFGLAPAWQACRGGSGAALKEGGRSSATSGGRRLGNALLVVEVALSIVLLVGATLLLRSFAKVTGTDPGFNPENVLAFRLMLPRAIYPVSRTHVAFFDRLIETIQAKPGVQSVGMVQTLPMRGNYSLSFTIEGRPVERGAEPSVGYRAVSPGYFAALQIPLVRGRTFGPQDSESSPLVAVVDEAFARRFFPNTDPIGHGLDIGNGNDGFARIVGVVGNVRYDALDTTAEPTMYAPFKQDTFGGMWFVVRTAGDPLQSVGSVRQAVREIDSGLAVFSITALPLVVSDSVAQRRFAMLLLGVFAVVALFLAAVGLYGLVAYSVSLRTQEIGLRMAIGAQPADVLRLIVGSGLKLALVGITVGIAAALGGARLIQAMLFEVTPFDATSYAATAGLLLTVCLVACYLPARRAMRLDPLVALRQD